MKSSLSAVYAVGSVSWLISPWAVSAFLVGCSAFYQPSKPRRWFLRMAVSMSWQPRISIPRHEGRCNCAILGAVIYPEDWGRLGHAIYSIPSCYRCTVKSSAVFVEGRAGAGRQTHMLLQWSCGCRCGGHGTWPPAPRSPSWVQMPLCACKDKTQSKTQ